MVVASTISISDKLSPCAAGPLLGPFMRPNRLEASLAHVFGPAAPPSEGFLRTAYAALTFNGGNLILHRCVACGTTEPCMLPAVTLS